MTLSLNFDAWRHTFVDQQLMLIIYSNPADDYNRCEEHVTGTDAVNIKASRSLFFNPLKQRWVENVFAIFDKNGVIFFCQ